MNNEFSRRSFTDAYMQGDVSMEQLGLRFGVSRTTVKEWAKRFGLPRRFAGGLRSRDAAPLIVLLASDNHCDPVNDGPELGDPDPEQIADRCAYIRAVNLLAMQTLEDEHCEHRRRGRCHKCTARRA